MELWTLTKAAISGVVDPDQSDNGCNNRCVYARDGVCDDSRGTGYCVLGSDCQVTTASLRTLWPIVKVFIISKHAHARILVGLWPSWRKQQ